MSIEDIQQQVDAFITDVKRDELGESPGQWPNEKVKDLCMKLIQEETGELMAAMQENDWPEIIDGAADSIYVILYAMSKAGIRLDPYWQEVCWTNLQKAGGPKDPNTGKQLKPAGWKPPRISEMLKVDRTRYSKLKELGILDPDSTQNVHLLKIRGQSFVDILEGRKTHEWRQESDRFFKIGDILVLQEFGNEYGSCAHCMGSGVDNPENPDSPFCLQCAGTGEGRYSGREILARVTSITHEAQMAMMYGATINHETRWVVMSIRPMWIIDFEHTARCCL